MNLIKRATKKWINFRRKVRAELLSNPLKLPQLLRIFFENKATLFDLAISQQIRLKRILPGHMQTSILSASLPVSLPSLTPLQSQVEGLVGGFVHQASDWRSLAAMTA